MEVKENIQGNAYKGLIEYAIEKNNVVSVTYSPNQHKEDNNFLYKILKESKYDKKYIQDNFSFKLVGEIFETLKENTYIFDEQYSIEHEEYLKINTKFECYQEFIKNYKENADFRNRFDIYKLCCINIDFENITYDEFKEFIKNHPKLNTMIYKLGYLYYDNIVEKFLELWKDNIIGEKKVIEKNDNSKEKIISITYFLKIDDKFRSYILSKNSIYDWIFPLSIENLCFYKDGVCWLCSVSHEELIEIYCINKKEYNYLKSLGICFKSNKFKSNKYLIKKSVTRNTVQYL